MRYIEAYSNQRSSNILKSTARCLIKNRGSDFFTISFEAIVLPKAFSNIPYLNLQAKTWDQISNLQLANPNFHESSPVGMLLVMKDAAKCSNSTSLNFVYFDRS